MGTRYLLAYFYKREVSSKLFDEVYGEQQVNKREGDKWIPKHISHISIGDYIRVERSAVIPLDGKIVVGHSYFNESLISGESHPILRKAGEVVKSGSKNLGEAIEIEIIASGKKNSFYNYLCALNFDTNNLDGHARFGGIYSVILGLFLIGSCITLFLLEPFSVAWEKSLALMIICCPCALGIGIPLATLLKLKAFANKGILVRDKSLFEKFSAVKTLCFDKTGTLTTGEYRVEKVTGDSRGLSWLVALEERSEHPVAKFLVRHFGSYRRDGIEPEHFKEIPGRGVEGRIEGNVCRVFAEESGEIVMTVDGRKRVRVVLEESCDPHIGRVLKRFRHRFAIEIISGDTGTRVAEFCRQIGLGPGDGISALDSLKPEQKRNYLRQKKSAIYVGDGLNDVLAMREADISISLNASKLVDDVCSAIFSGGRLGKTLSVF